MGIPTLIKTLTASDTTHAVFVDGTDDVVFDSTYDEYMFVFTDINPATDETEFIWQVNATDDAGGGFDTSLITTTFFRATHTEGDSTGLAYVANSDIAQYSGDVMMSEKDQAGNGSDESSAGILHIFSPSSTTYVKHFYSRMSTYIYTSGVNDQFVAGYINDTTAIDEIRFYFNSGNFDGVIQLYGIS